MPSLQTPINSGFGARTEASDALGGARLDGKLAIVTGGASGIGLETTKALAGAGARVIVAVRDIERARAALAGVANIELAALDLMDPASIAGFAQSFIASGRKLDILINNAGIMAAPLTRDARGYEAQFATNHLGHFHLTALLWPALTGGARVVTVSSLAHRVCGVDLDDPSFERGAYDRWQAYGRAKSANALFAVALDRRGQAHGVRAFSVHPGGIATALQRYMPDEEKRAMGFMDAEGRISDRFKTPSQGASTSVWCAGNAQLAGMGGVYCEDCDIAAPTSSGAKPGPGVRAWAIDPEIAEQLWSLSERMTGVRFAV